VNSRLIGLDVGTQFRRYGEVRLGLERGTLQPSLDTGPTSLAPGVSDIALGAYTVRLVLDQLDNVHFPRFGWRGGARIYSSDDRFGADQNYDKWDIDGLAAYSFGEHTFQVAVKAGGKYGPRPLPRYDQFQWGGFMQQSGYATGQLLGESLQFGRVMYYHRILRGSLLEGAYGGFSLEAGKVGNPLVPGAPEGLLQSASLFLAVDSPVGPLYWGYGRARDGASSLYFYLGKFY
jgi:NTE family protein